MIRVMHVMSPTGDLQSQRCAALLHSTAGKQFSIETRWLGPRGLGRNILFAASALYRLSRDFDVLHAWDAQSARLSILLAGKKAIYSPSGTPTGSVFDALLRAVHSNSARVCCATASQRQIFLNKGVPQEVLTVIRPAVDRQVNGSIDPAFRQALGLYPQDRVLLAPGESTRSAGHRYALWAASILHVLDPRYRLLVWGRGDALHALEHLALSFRQPRLLVTAEKQLGREIEFEALVRAADAALVTPMGVPSVLPIQICQAAGLPIVASAGPVASELLSAGENVRIVERLAPRLLAQSMLTLFDKPPERQAANVHPSDQPLTSEFVEAYRAEYRRIAAGRRRCRE